MGKYTKANEEMKKYMEGEMNYLGIHRSKKTGHVSGFDDSGKRHPHGKPSKTKALLGKIKGLFKKKLKKTTDPFAAGNHAPYSD